MVKFKSITDSQRRFLEYVFNYKSEELNKNEYTLCKDMIHSYAMYPEDGTTQRNLNSIRDKYVVDYHKQNDVSMY